MLHRNMLRKPRHLRPEFLFRPRSVAVIGSQTAFGSLFVRNLQEGGFAGELHLADDPEGLSATPDLGVIATETIQPGLDALAARGVPAAILATNGPWRPTSCRVLGPGAFGIIVPGAGLNVSSGHLPARPGKLALVTPSAALCRSVLDWAEPNGVGFSHIVGTGAEADIDAATILDFLSREPATGAILLDIRTIRDRRAFLSAARAAARQRPIVAIRAGARQHDPSGRSDQVFAAALRRAGILRVTTMAELLAAAETLTRARAPRTETLMVVTNAVSLGQMAADQAVRLGIPLATPDAAAKTVLQAHLPPQPHDPGLVWTGEDQPTRLAEAAAMVATLPEVGGVAAILAPTGPADTAGIEALAACQRALKVPLLTCVLGETTGAGHRRALADAGVPVFASPEQAVRGFWQLVRQRRARAAARELPSSRVLLVAPDLDRVRRVLDRAAGRTALSDHEAGEVLAAYAIPVMQAAPRMRAAVTQDPLFGPAIAFGPGGDHGDEAAYELPPLNLTLASSLVTRSPAGCLLEDADRDAVADALVRVSQLAIDFPEIASLVIDPLFASAASIELHATGKRSIPAIAPYPADLVEHWTAHGETLEIRPIRPEDAEAHAALFARLSPEDIRYRFFSMMRELSPEQIARMTQVDYDREMALVAVRGADTVGVARLVREPESNEAEFAILVDPSMKGRGVGRHLMQRLIAWGRSLGLDAIVGQILADNAPMLAFIRGLGFEVHHIPGESDVVEARMKL